jgi:hypothetical protein
MASNAAATIHFESRPPGTLASSVRKLVSDFYSEMSVPEEAVSRVSLAAHELLENVAKYGDGGEASIDFELTERDGHSFMQVRTRNRTTVGQLDELRHVLDEVQGAADPIALYYQYLAQGSERTDRSRIGLARIRAEAEMTLVYSIEGDEVVIAAEGSVEDEGTVP